MATAETDPDVLVQVRALKIATSDTRYSTTWRNDTILWTDLCARLATTTRTRETVAAYRDMPKSRQDEIKDIGGFVGGHLRDGRRKTQNVTARSMIALDIDHYQPGLLDTIEMLLDYEAYLYTTHKHTPAAPRYRLVLPLTRDVTADEYQAVARKIASHIGIDAFDDTTYEPARLMYWPSTSSDGEYDARRIEGDWVNPDLVLAEYADWTDTTTWPVSTRQSKAVTARATRQADPRSKRGVVGAFCTIYPISVAISEFLADIYAPSAHEDRYDYIPGESSSGVATYDQDRYAYSHHATDPANGQLLNSFDLVRIHRYGDLDDDVKPETPANRVPSYLAMSDWARTLDPVKTELARRAASDAATDFTPVPAEHENWTKGLSFTRQDKVADTLGNLVTITSRDTALASIAYNLHRDSVDVRGPDSLPWTPLKPGWTDTDFAQLNRYIEARYGLYSPTKLKQALLVSSSARAYHPVREYLEALPAWDHVPRVETLLVDYLGAEDTPYVRAATRKWLLGGHARVYRPGTKFDNALILVGPQGTGKSTLLARLGGAWFTDALTVADMRDKTGAEKLQGQWIVEIPELTGLRKVDVETVKSFITREDDKYRVAYGINVESHPRQCVIAGTTNAETGFLRDVTGNRRFWPVYVTGRGVYRPWDLDQATVGQVWAEIRELAKQGEPLFLTGVAAEMAAAAQDAAMEEDERLGLVTEYLDRLLPADWDTMGLTARRNYLDTETDLSVDTVGTEPRVMVTHAEIWAECFGKDPAMMRPTDSWSIAAILKQVAGWERATERVRVPIYGRQRYWTRTGVEK